MSALREDPVHGDDPTGRRARIESIFDAVLELADDEREAYVTSACADDAQLRAEVLALLRAHARASGILEDNKADLLEPRTGGPRLERIGAYTIERQIGRGGMGSVYLAQRDDGQFHRRVAIKLLRTGADDLLLYRRFLAERQILASLDHPNIARLYDGGVTENGMPYLVMEYVEGLTITDYCDRHRLGIEERVRLFRSVCETVHYAHQNLVIHRDLKPSNIFVSAGGNVKLLDFGIAKLMGAGMAALGAPVTLTDLRIMTPEYASPEQLRGDPLTTASDVYALGVVLYELLCGQHPYEMTRHSPEEVVRAVLERDPDRPSVRIRQDGVAAAPERTPARIAAARGLTPERLQRRLRGDLDAIVMVALRKEPNRRYHSADLLSQDLERYLEGEPVTAHRGGRGYRLIRLIKRHRTLAASLTLVFATLVAGAGVTWWQASRARSERDRAEHALARSEIALGETQAVSDFLFQLFQVSAPGDVGGDTIRARDLLRRGEERAERLGATPAVQARMLDVVGRIHEQLGNYAQARPVLERALAIREATFGPRSAETAESLANLGLVLRRTGEFSRSIELWERAVSIRRELYGETDTTVARTLVALAGMYIYRGRLEDSERTYAEALRIMEQIVGPDGGAVAGVLLPYGGLLRARGKGQESEAMFRRALDLRVRTLGPDQPEVSEPMFNLADLVWDNRADTAEAIRLHRDAVALVQRTLGENHPTYGGSMNRLADALARYGRTAAADSAFRLARAVIERVNGPRHPNLGLLLVSHAHVLYRLGRKAEAERMAAEGVARAREGWGDKHNAYAGALTAHAQLRLAEGDIRTAEPMFREALRIRGDASGYETSLVGLSLADLGVVAGERGDLAAADSLTTEALRILRANFPEHHDDIKYVHRQAARYNEKWGRPEIAERHLAALRAARGTQD